MRHLSQSFAIILASFTAFPAAATPTDALINNTLSLPAELNKAMIVHENVTQDVAELRGSSGPLFSVSSLSTSHCRPTFTASMSHKREDSESASTSVNSK